MMFELPAMIVSSNVMEGVAFSSTPVELSVGEVEIRAGATVSTVMRSALETDEALPAVSAC